MERESGAKAREKELYDMLVRIGTNTYTDQERLVNLSGLYPTRQGARTFHDSTARRMLSDDIQSINEAPEYPGIIISSPGCKGVKLATSEEAGEYILRQKIACFQRLMRLAKLEEKLMLSGQMNFDGKEHTALQNAGQREDEGR